MHRRRDAHIYGRGLQLRLQLRHSDVLLELWRRTDGKRADSDSFVFSGQLSDHADDHESVSASGRHDDAELAVSGPPPPPPPPPTPTGCPTMVANANVFFTYRKASNTCNQNRGTCVYGESITLTASGFNYDFGCSSHTFSWNSGDGATASGQTVSHSFVAGGSYSVRLTITNSSQPQGVTLTQSVAVGGSPAPPTPAPPTCN
jgi:PKD domain-containing protein